MEGLQCEPAFLASSARLAVEGEAGSAGRQCDVGNENLALECRYWKLAVKIRLGAAGSGQLARGACRRKPTVEGWQWELVLKPDSHWPNGEHRASRSSCSTTFKRGWSPRLAAALGRGCLSHRCCMAKWRLRRGWR